MPLNREIIENIIIEEILRCFCELESGISETPRLLFIHPAPFNIENLNTASISSMVEKYNSATLPANQGFPETDFFGLRQISSTMQNISFARIVDSIQAFILVHPPISFLHRTVEGMGDELPVKILQHALLSRKPVIGLTAPDPLNLAKEDKKDRTSPDSRIMSHFQAHYDNLSRILSNWGVVWEREENLFSIIRDIMEPSGEDTSTGKNAAIQNSRRMIVTSEDVENRIRSGEISWNLPENAIVTALAFETARKYDFSLNKK